MVAVALSLVDRPRPRPLAVVNLPGVPNLGDAIQHDGRGYQVEGKVFHTDPKSEVLGKTAQVVLILSQISGPPHVKLAS